MNAIFVANKPALVSSNRFLYSLKRKYGVKKAGFSGTLDPFATGSLIVAFGAYTRFFKYLNKTPKIYEATIWLGASSPSGDNENINDIKKINSFDIDRLNSVKNALIGILEYIPPKFSAKKINGQRAYDLVRKGIEFELRSQKMQVFSCEILSYNHPFLNIKIAVDEGAYIRSYAQIFAKKLGVNATLSSLHRVSEGKFRFENEKFLNPADFLNLDKNEYLGDILNFKDGKNLQISDFKNRQNGKYLLEFDKFFSIIEIEEDCVKYCLNKVEKC